MCGGRAVGWERTCSTEAQLKSLFRPSRKKLLSEHQFVRTQLGRLASMKDLLGDPGRQEAETEEAAEIGLVDPGRSREFGHGFALAGHDHLMEPVRLTEQPHQAAIRFWGRRAVEQEFCIDPGPFQSRRDRQSRQLLIFWRG